MTEWAKKAPALVAIVALVVVGVRALDRGGAGGGRAAGGTAIAGLGGFYLREVLPRKG